MATLTQVLALVTWTGSRDIETPRHGFSFSPQILYLSMQRCEVHPGACLPSLCNTVVCRFDSQSFPSQISSRCPRSTRLTPDLASHHHRKRWFFRHHNKNPWTSYYCSPIFHGGKKKTRRGSKVVRLESESVRC